MKKKYILSAYLIGAIVLGLILAIWRTVLILNDYDPYLMEFSYAAKEKINILGYATFAVLLLMASAFLVFRKTTIVPFEASAAQSTVFTSSFSGFIFFAIALLLLIYCKDAVFADTAHFFFRGLQVISLFLMFPAAGYFLLNASAEPNGTKAKRALSFFPTLWALFYLICSYANPMYNYSDPNRLFCNVSLIALLWFYLFETRKNVSKPILSAQFVFGLFAIVSIFVYIVPTALLTSFWEMDLAVSTIFEAAEIGAVAYVISMMVMMIKNLEPVQEAPAPAEAAEEKEPTAE